jgi:hypothetical protein
MSFGVFFLFFGAVRLRLGLFRFFIPFFFLAHLLHLLKIEQTLNSMSGMISLASLSGISWSYLGMDRGVALDSFILMGIARL